MDKRILTGKGEIEFFVNEPGIPEFTVRAFADTTASGESHTYYFNEARPMNATKKLMKMMGQMPDDICNPNKALHLIAIPPHTVAAHELNHWARAGYEIFQ